jgi:hypothetical protein
MLMLETMLDVIKSRNVLVISTSMLTSTNHIEKGTQAQCLLTITHKLKRLENAGAGRFDTVTRVDSTA